MDVASAGEIVVVEMDPTPFDPDDDDPEDWPEDDDELGTPVTMS